MLGVATLLLLSATWAYAQPNSGWQKDGERAKAFCSSPTFKSLSCGWAAKAEQDATQQNQCLWCGTLWRAELSGNLPLDLFGNPNYYQQAGRVVSLACKGRVVVRAVFKLLAQPTNDPGPGCAYVFLNNDAGSSPSPVIRCELQLPPGSAPEAQRALVSKEAKCYVCDRCGKDAGCPAVPGKWYSDSFTTTMQGCDFNTTKGYVAQKANIGLNAPGSIQLAKFEVCNSPSCFDAAYEANKARTAKKCTAKGCPP